jgi:hypothetical protein
MCTNKRLSEEERPITLCELHGFFGLLLAFGLTHKNDIEINEMWRVGGIHHQDLASAAMSRDRFKLIANKICFDEIESREMRKTASPKFFKMKEVFSLFKRNIKRCLVPGERLCIDEMLYAFRGRCSFRQYIPNKPAKYGIKFWSIVDVASSYVLDIDVYLGAQANPDDKNKKEQSVGESVVLALTKPFEETPRIITCDNFFTSYELACLLWSKKLRLVGNKKTLYKNIF